MGQEKEPTTTISEDRYICIVMNVENAPNQNDAIIIGVGVTDPNLLSYQTNRSLYFHNFAVRVRRLVK